MRKYTKTMRKYKNIMTQETKIQLFAPKSLPGVWGMGVINGFVDGTNSGASPRKVPATAPEAFKVFKSLLRVCRSSVFLGGATFLFRRWWCSRSRRGRGGCTLFEGLKKSGNRISRWGVKWWKMNYKNSPRPSTNVSFSKTLAGKLFLKKSGPSSRS